MKKIKNTIIIIATALLSYSCGDYLDIVPDNIATIESAFTLRSTAERYLFTCYSWLPPHMNLTTDRAFLPGGEMYALHPHVTISGFMLVRQGQNSLAPYLNYWSGTSDGTAMFEAIRNCNIFLENIGKVNDITEAERARWIAEAKFLKAWYHFHLLRMYGPVPLIKENLPIGSETDEVRVFRDPVDECFDYIVELLDEALVDLPETIVDRITEMGRITRPIAASIKAKVLVTAASPFYNGNSDYADFIDKKERVLFNQTYEAEKWKKAADACKEAIALCEETGIALYYYTPLYGYSCTEATVYQMNHRNSVCDRWNCETIWASPNHTVNQSGITPRSWNPDIPNTNTTGRYGSSIEFTETYYTKNGVPIDEDKTWDYANRFDLQVGDASNKNHIRQGYTTVKMHFDREIRFYASIGFDGGQWYGQGKYNDADQWMIQGKMGQYTGIFIATNYSPTGYWPKKLIHYQNIVSTTSTYSTNWYPVPIMRLADLYLLYAEALNEYYGPTDEALSYLDSIRSRVGLPKVKDAWTEYSNNPTKYQSKDGLREIIQQERQIELAFESSRYWDLIRWKKLLEMQNKPISGWNLTAPEAEQYYQPQVLDQFTFTKRYSLDPIKDSDILVNNNLVQNPGW